MSKYQATLRAMVSRQLKKLEVKVTMDTIKPCSKEPCNQGFKG